MEPQNTMTLENLLEEIGQPKALERILTSFSRATGLKALLVEPKGHVLTAGGDESGFCGFCREIRATLLGRERCRCSYARAGAQAVMYGEPYIFRCHAGLVAWAAPVMVGNEHLASIICNQILMWEPEDYFWEEIVEMTKDLTMSPDHLMKLAHQLPVVCADKVQAAADLLFATANYIAQSSFETLEQRREIAAQQSRLGEEMRARKILEAAVHSVNRKEPKPYSLAKETELAGKVRRGNKEGALRVLNDLLIDITERFPGNSKETKGRVIELLVIISRAAAEAGAGLRQLLTMNSAYVEEMGRTKDCDALCFVVTQAAEKYLDCVRESRGIKNQNVIRKAVEFIRTHYHEHITIEDIARAAYVSPCHLSRIFKNELCCTVLDFLTHARMEESKKLLSLPEYKISRVASETGFDDSSYFSKVFRRLEGISPSQYRHKAQ